MTMLSFPTDEPQVDPTRPGQWRLAQIELVNWGTFAGHVSVDVARAGHLFTGASGSGKSSLLDAIAAVLTPDKWLRLMRSAYAKIRPRNRGFLIRMHNFNLQKRLLDRPWPTLTYSDYKRATVDEFAADEWAPNPPDQNHDDGSWLDIDHAKQIMEDDIEDRAHNCKLGHTWSPSPAARAATKRAQEKASEC